MKFASAKHAIGWYEARRKGPARLQAFDPSSKATRTPYRDNAATMLHLATLLHAEPPDGLGLLRTSAKCQQLLRWATTSDDAGIEPDRALVEDLEDLLEAAGLLNRVEIPKGAPIHFEDLYTGQTVRTWREDADAMRNTMTSAEAADYLGIPLGTLHEWRRRGEGPAYVRATKRSPIRYFRADLDDFLRKCVHDPSEGVDTAGEA